MTPNKLNLGNGPFMNGERKVRIAGVATDSVVDGPGIRSVVFFQGCPHQCPGCHNPETWRPDGGSEISLPELVRRLNLNPLVAGVTFSGGEPFLQAPAAAELGKYLREQGLSLWVYTGYTWEDLLTKIYRPGYKELLEITEVLIDGPFIREEADLRLLFRGSANQRMIRVVESLDAGTIIPWRPGADDHYGLG